MNFPRSPQVNRSIPARNPSWLQCPEPDVREEQFDEILDVASQVSRDEWPREFLVRHGLPQAVPAPLLDVVKNEKGQVSAMTAAYLVRMDHPFDLGHLLNGFLRKHNRGYQHPRAGEDEFDLVYGLAFTDARTAWKVAKSLEIAFGLKNLFRVPRSEDHFGCNMTRYADQYFGDHHWSDVAGHGTAAGATVASLLDRVPALSIEFQKILVVSGLHFAYYRSFAGVHRAVENSRGFVVGWASARRLLFDQALDQVRAFVPGLVVAA